MKGKGNVLALRCFSVSPQYTSLSLFQKVSKISLETFMLRDLGVGVLGLGTLDIFAQSLFMSWGCLEGMGKLPDAQSVL